ncbi:hypothetical protein K0M31_002795 [Melipona bicolor]|uniref:non-specific serine/threonine protein kinase n=1 Tax=Melipona bicolor TaxID=60889 RepID=A0AA40FZR1_9HYME|nr:hypothetical protein K0M31_002795 [Melipona bicolor]
MFHRFNKSIRTYERNKLKEVKILVPKIIVPSIDENKTRNPVSSNENLDETEKKVDDSLYNDPFETTFDRLLKNARIPPPVSRSDTLSLSSDSKSETSDHKSLYRMSSFSKKPIFKQNTSHRQINMRVMKKRLIKKKALKNNEEFKVEKNVSHKKYNLRKTRNNNKLPLTYLGIEKIKRNYNKKYIHSAEKSKKINNVQSVKFSNNVEIKPCFVHLDKSITSECYNNLHSVDNNVLKETDQLLDQCAITEINIDNLKHNGAKVNKYIAPLDLKKKNENIFSSTPNGKLLRSSTSIISLSPIPIQYFEKLRDPIMSSNASTNENNEILLNSEVINDDLHKRSNTIEKAKEKPELSNYLLNTSNQLKNVDNKDTDSLIKLNYNNNEICNQKELLARRNVVPIIPSGIEQNNTLHKSVLIEEHKISNMENRSLRFSSNASSCSLFSDNESIPTPLCNDTEVDDIVKISNSNLIVSEKSTILKSERHFDFVELNKKSSNVNTNKKVIPNKIQELSAISTSINLTKSDSLSDNINNKNNDETGDKNNDDKNSALNTKYSFRNTSRKYNDFHVSLEKLQNPIRVSKRKKYNKWDLEMTIAEDCSNIKKKKERHSEKINNDRQTILQQKELSVLENIIEQSTNHAIEKPVYLKPGKSWLRSLSILNNVQTKSNLDKLSIGKGKKWRHSVQDVLNMQKQGIIQSCIKKNDNDNDKKLQITNEVINKSEYELINNSKDRTYNSTIFGHLSRKISIRVVPLHKTVKSIEDASFLKVYGIVPIKDQRCTLLNNPKKSSICNIQNDDIDGQVIEEHVISTAREVILQRCLQKDYIAFSTYFSDKYLEHCRKIGEGVYGEVFLYEHEDEKSVIKIIPIEGSDYVNGEPQKKFHEILSEIVIAMELYNLRFNTRYNTDGFVEVKNIKCIKGKYPERLIELWNIYDEEKHSDNDCPSMFNDEQLYIVLELGHGGQDLEAFVFNTAEEAHILFIQAALALAVAEKAVEFEHRDLHWGNILISPTNENYIHYKIGQKNIELISKGVKVSIIDFTFSRVKYQGCSVFNDLALDPTLFTAQGEYQFEIYRLMRDRVKNNWQTFEPYTNILWLHYTLDKMITAVRYKKRNLKIHKNGITKLKKLENEILTYNSAFDFVTNCDKIVNILRINSESDLISV